MKKAIRHLRLACMPTAIICGALIFSTRAIANPRACEDLFSARGTIAVEQLISELATIRQMAQMHEGTPAGARIKSDFTARFNVLAQSLGRENLVARLREELHIKTREREAQEAKAYKPKIITLNTDLDVDVRDIRQSGKFLTGTYEGHVVLTKLNGKKPITAESFQKVELVENTEFGVISHFNSSEVITYQGRDVLFAKSWDHRPIHAIRYLDESGDLSKANPAETFVLPSQNANLMSSPNSRYWVGKDENGVLYRLDLETKKREATSSSLFSRLTGKSGPKHLAGLLVGDDGRMKTWTPKGEEIEYDSEMRLKSKTPALDWLSPNGNFAKSGAELFSVSPDGKHAVVLLEKNTLLISLTAKSVLKKFERSHSTKVAWYDSSVGITVHDNAGSWKYLDLSPNPQVLLRSHVNDLYGSIQIPVWFEQGENGTLNIHARNLSNGWQFDMDISPFLPIHDDLGWLKDLYYLRPRFVFNKSYTTLAIFKGSDDWSTEVYVIDLVGKRLAQVLRFTSGYTEAMGFVDNDSLLYITHETNARDRKMLTTFHRLQLEAPQ